MKTNIYVPLNLMFI